MSALSGIGVRMQPRVHAARIIRVSLFAFVSA
jgi:hypothetical protein